MSNIEQSRIVRLTPSQIAELNEYSCSTPTGTWIGKLWKRNSNFQKGEEVLTGEGYVIFPMSPKWILCEYVDGNEPGYING